MKKLIYMMIICPFFLFGQQPIINSISPTNVEVGQTVTISGSGLTGVTQVFFGGVSVSGADVNIVSDNLIEAIVPAGATFGPITVLNSTSDLIAQSTEQFFISFDGTSLNTYDAEVATSTSVTDVNDICICDLDGDNRNDIIIAHNVINGLTPNALREISIFRNQSTSTTPDFSDLITLNNSVNLDGFISTTCADLDNDGQPELIFVTNNATLTRHAIVYQNNSTVGTITMNPLNSLIIRLPNTPGGANRIPRKIRAGDMDGDGKKDLVIGNDADQTIHIFQNQSSGPGNFSFPTDTEITSGDDFSGLIYLADLDNDGREDIISAPFRDQATLGTSSVYLIKNNSIVDNLSFSFEGSISNGNQRISNIIAGDFNEDGLNDVIVSSSDGGSINIARNVTTGGTISFIADESFSGIGTPFGLGLGDMNGDGRIDLISSLAAQDLLIYENNSTANDIAFQTPVTVTTSNTTREVCIGDLNQDAKPDIAYALDINSVTDGKFGVRTNENQIVPTITPSSGDYCRTPETFTLSATKSTSTPIAPVYNWSIQAPATGNIIGTGDNIQVEITSVNPTATIQLSIDQDGTTGSTTSSVTLDIITDTQPAAPVIADPGVICAGDPVTLDVTLPGNYDELEWTLPDGSTVTTAQIIIASTSIDDAGNYQVKGKTTGGCFSEESVAFGLQISSPPTLEILNNNNDVFCADGANDPQLEVSDIVGLTYQWRRNGVNITPGGTDAIYTAIESGDYTVQVTDANACSQVTSAYTVTEVSLPNALISGPSETCVNFETTFTANSTVQSGFTPVNSWIVEDATNIQIGSSNTDDLVFTFPAVGTYEVILTTVYDPALVASCQDVVTQVVTVSPEPTITFNVLDGAEKCQLDALTVSVTSPDPTSITGYDWVLKNAFDLSEIPNSASTNASIDATTPIGVDSVYAVVTITTDIGCQVTDSVKIQNFPTDIDIASDDFDLSSDSVTLEDDNFIVLTAQNVTAPAWSPNSIINDTTASRVTVFPSLPETTITLTGTDSNGCLVASTVTITLDNIRPRRTFSPNGDNLGFDCWEILNTSTLEGCKVYVFDSRGRNILVEDSPFENNCVWDGNFNGSPVPEGIYYFVLRCNDDNLSKTGSILLAR